jgi:hypothetical protein
MRWSAGLARAGPRVPNVTAQGLPVYSAPARRLSSTTGNTPVAAEELATSGRVRNRRIHNSRHDTYHA